ncbi:SAG-related sequence [Besnoitia besnoiti]|uniref:SAG-related sequence n=1 Tax=Besnoitia besnoiti TaxID=94643 RepID=A0A2A9MKY3_BESBE|nr:SAG-related sequence [Besnoitia besnoiti]PFH36100.1 SAG-related sequence [Besnoitia besnoiti]
MVSHPSALCSSAQAVVGAMRERAQRKGLSPSRLRLPFVAFVVAVAVVLVFASLPAIGAQQASPVPLVCDAKAPETTCTCSEAKGKASESETSATLSKETNILSVKCNNDLVFAPTGNKNTLVCPAGSGDLKDCKLDIVELLAKEPSGVQWDECNEREKSTGKCKTLTIPQANFPFVDESFAVGCTVNLDSNDKLCRIPVTIKARTSETNGQSVTCAYGAGSNESRQAVTLNPSKNSFTLVCGEKGTVLPTNYDTKFCSSDPAGTSTTCDGDYQSILPGFENGWWKKDDPATPKSFTLSIPVDKFPKEQAKMVVACQQTTPKPSSKIAKDEKATSSVCRVDVTIEAGSPASLSLGSWNLSSRLLALAVTLVMARGM